MLWRMLRKTTLKNGTERSESITVEVSDPELHIFFDRDAKNRWMFNVVWRRETSLANVMHLDWYLVRLGRPFFRHIHSFVES